MTAATAGGVMETGVLVVVLRMADDATSGAR